MAFKAGNKARKKESAQDSVANIIEVPSIDNVIDEFHHVVGEFTHDIRQSIRDRVNAAVLLYIVESDKKKLTKELLNNKALESTKKKKEESSSYSDTPYWDTLVNKIKNMENINESIPPLLEHEPNYCFNPIIRKIFAGDITDLVAYPYPVNCGLKLEDDEKKLLIDINNFKCSFMEETLGSLYLSTKIVLTEDVEIPDDESDLLGFYTKRIFTNPDQVEPEVWLLIMKIEAESISLGYDRKYVLAKVYIHEMMHRYYDMHPELLLKKSVKEIEEPMAEFATIMFCEEFCKDHVEHNELLNVAINQTNSLRSSDNYIYALGTDLYDFKYSLSLINKYRHTCMKMYEDNKPVVDYLQVVKNEESVNEFMNEDKSVAELFCNALGKCIDTYIL
jgi:hypothetical protein